MTEPALDEQTAQRYSDLARLHLEVTNAHVVNLIQTTSEEAPQEVRSALEAAQQYKYAPAKTVFSGVFWMAMHTTFDSGGRTYDFAGSGGGMGFGFSESWGAAWLNYPIESIVGWRFRFELNIAAQVVSIYWWGMKGEFIGTFIGGGVSIAAGIFGGQGSIK